MSGLQARSSEQEARGGGADRRGRSSGRRRRGRCRGLGRRRGRDGHVATSAKRGRLGTKLRGDSGAQDHRVTCWRKAAGAGRGASRRGGEITGGQWGPWASLRLKWRSNWEKGNGVWCGFCPWAGLSGLGPCVFGVYSWFVSNQIAYFGLSRPVFFRAPLLTSTFNF